MTNSEQLPARSLETQGGVPYPTAVTISGLKPNSSHVFFRIIMDSIEAIAPPNEWPTSLNLNPYNKLLVII